MGCCCCCCASCIEDAKREALTDTFMDVRILMQQDESHLKRLANKTTKEIQDMYDEAQGILLMDEKDPRGLQLLEQCMEYQNEVIEYNRSKRRLKKSNISLEKVYMKELNGSKKTENLREFFSFIEPKNLLSKSKSKKKRKAHVRKGYSEEAKTGNNEIEMKKLINNESSSEDSDEDDGIDKKKDVDLSEEAKKKELPEKKVITKKKGTKETPKKKKGPSKKQQQSSSSEDSDSSGDLSYKSVKKSMKTTTSPANSIYLKALEGEDLPLLVSKPKLKELKEAAKEKKQMREMFEFETSLDETVPPRGNLPSSKLNGVEPKEAIDDDGI